MHQNYVVLCKLGIDLNAVDVLAEPHLHLAGLCGNVNDDKFTASFLIINTQFYLSGTVFDGRRQDLLWS